MVRGRYYTITARNMLWKALVMEHELRQFDFGLELPLVNGFLFPLFE